MTNRQMIREIRKPGRIAVPVLTANDVIHLVVEKFDIIAELEGLDPDVPCAWEFITDRHDGVRRIDKVD